MCRAGPRAAIFSESCDCGVCECVSFFLFVRCARGVRWAIGNQIGRARAQTQLSHMGGWHILYTSTVVHPGNASMVRCVPDHLSPRGPHRLSVAPPASGCRLPPRLFSDCASPIGFPMSRGLVTPVCSRIGSKIPETVARFTADSVNLA